VRIALLSDVHANLDALTACLQHARERAVGQYAFLGDLVGYGAEPGAVVDVVAGLVAGGAIAVRGNHDAAIAETSAAFEDDARESIAWTRAALTGPQKEFLSALPLSVRRDDLCFVHSSAVDPQAWRYIETAADARESIDASGAIYTFSGHVHDQVLYFRTLAGKTAPFRPTSGSAVPVPSHRGWLAIVGSVGQPRDHNAAAAYAVFDSEAEEITFYRVPYDHAAAAEKIRRAGLPQWLAHRVDYAV
jgi:diadenosine tetraphosphatase ApaH/serine/threonine PP2A family protein phosphatase